MSHALASCCVGVEREAQRRRSEAGRHPEPLFAGVCFPPGRISGAASGREGGRSGSRLRALRVHDPARRTSWGRPSSRFPPRSDPRDLRTASRRREDAGQLAQHVLDHLAGRNFLDRGETAGAAQNLLFLLPPLPSCSAAPLWFPPRHDLLVDTRSIRY
ncbi:zinc finger protein 580 isoform X4 [Balaenoptera ricei]|uniref:zinc finger protein 580 isoform X4 n=1 Tax=Balaenoptera ricei TaxID=2746895 RepID=UPI0028BE0442|nr:zinc finger protein 580 isoform X4 [Balaenoptera ricei]